MLFGIILWPWVRMENSTTCRQRGVLPQPTPPKKMLGFQNSYVIMLSATKYFAKYASKTILLNIRNYKICLIFKIIMKFCPTVNFYPTIHGLALPPDRNITYGAEMMFLPILILINQCRYCNSFSFSYHGIFL